MNRGKPKTRKRVGLMFTKYFIIMKNIFLKSVIPTAAILFAIGGSFATHASEKKSQVDVPAFAPQGGTNPCLLTFTCSNVNNGVLCTALIGTNLTQFYGKLTPEAAICPITLWQRQ